MSQPDISGAAEHMRRFSEAITAAGGDDDLALGAQVSATALSLYESLYDELSLHMPELPEERRAYLAEFLVRRVFRDHGLCSEPGCRTLAVDGTGGLCSVHEREHAR